MDELTVRSFSSITDDFLSLYRKSIHLSGLETAPNYAEDDADGVVRMMGDGRLHLYNFVLKNNVLMAASGLRLNVDLPGVGPVAQCSVRMMSICADNSLRRYPYIMAKSLPIEMDMAIRYRFKNCILTFNEHNRQLAETLEKRVLRHPDVPPLVRGFKLLGGFHLVNNVQQYVMIANNETTN